VLPTILSRCQRFDFRRIPLDALEHHLTWIAEQEQIGISAEALHVVAQRAQGGLRDAESLLDQLSLLPAPIEPQAVWDLVGAVPEQELLQLAESLASSEPMGVIEAIRTLLERGREPGAVLQGLAGLLRDLVLAGVAPDRLELTSFSPQFRPQLPALARSIGKARLLQWQAQLKGSEQQLRQSVQPRLWLEVLLLGLLAEAQAAAPRITAVPAAASAPVAAAVPVSTPVPEAGQKPQAEPAPKPAPEPALNTTAAAAPAEATPADTNGEASTPNLQELWQQILAGLELPSTRMLLSQQAVLARLDQQRAVVQVAGNWMAMVQSRLPLLEKAVHTALGSPRQVVLEGSGGAVMATAPATAAPSKPAPLPPPAPVPAPEASPEPVQNTPAAAAKPAAPQPVPTAPPAPMAEPPRPGQPELIDDKARRLADFFNGEVVLLDGPLPDADDAMQETAA
jgi:DNA polymerase-3 subunit gamma/tau